MAKTFNEGYVGRLIDDKVARGGPAYYLPIFGVKKKGESKV